MTDDDASVEDQLRQIADEFGREYDPLKKYSEKFKRMEEKLGIDPFEMFLDDVVRGTSRNQGTIDEYERAIDHYKTVMRRYGRHPACPHDEHVESYIEYEMNERGNEKSTVQTYIIYINKAYKYLQGEIPSRTQTSSIRLTTSGRTGTGMK
jgi:integrase/recombinase XerD